MSPAPAARPSTVPDLLAARLRTDPAAPLVTFYDDATGERTELSVTSFANWAAKTANLLVEELDLEPGDTLLLDLPTHWLVPVFLAGAWTAGVAVTTRAEVEHDAVVTSADAAADHAGARPPVLACSLHPMALPARVPLPGGVLDHGTLWAGQGDVFVAMEPLTGATAAWRGLEGADAEHGTLDHATLLARAAAERPGRSRLLTDRHPAAVEVFPGPLVEGGSLVLVRRPDPESWAGRTQQERATEVTRS